jgi:hypothetical protein
VAFEVRPDKVSIECNENGFTHENLKAICAIGKSSKVGAAGYIGEKGIGFKSVFMAAWKVHIQSNDFSFSFTHRKGDSGLGMVTPVWEDADESLGGSSTRITLFLHTSDDPEEDVRQRETIRLQFQDLQHTILLFLRKLRKVQVSFFDEDDTRTSITTYSLHGSNPVTVKKETFESVEERQYHVTKHVAKNIPKSENRTYSDEQDRADSSTEVVLAFPLSESGTPIVENQDVFAFLPMRPMGFKVSESLSVTIAEALPETNKCVHAVPHTYRFRHRSQSARHSYWIPPKPRSLEWHLRLFHRSHRGVLSAPDTPIPMDALATPTRLLSLGQLLVRSPRQDRSAHTRG